MRTAARLALALAVLAPLASAEHEHSHRLVVAGRVVDAAGEPVPGAPVELRVVGAEAGGACFDQASARTDEEGDFELCRHAHALPGGAAVEVAVGNRTVSAAVPADVRRAYVAVRLDHDWPVRSVQGERAFAREHLVTGVLLDLHARPVEVEGQPVRATPRAGHPVDVTLLGPDGAALASGHATTGLDGAFEVALAVAEAPDGARVVADAGHVSREAPADAAMRRTDLVLARATGGSGEPAPPGTGRVPGAWAALALGALGAASASRRR